MKRIAGLYVCVVLVVISASSSVFGYNNNGYPYTVFSGCTSDCYSCRYNFCKNNCTSYAAYMLNTAMEFNFHNGYKSVGWHNGENWDNAARTVGITVDDTPLPGSIAYWNSMYEDDKWGHVAFVERVRFNGDKVDSIDYTQYNVVPKCSFSEKTNVKPIHSDYPDGFIHIALHEFGILYYVDCLEMSNLVGRPFSNQTGEERDKIIKNLLPRYINVTISSSQQALADAYFGPSGYGGGGDPNDPEPTELDSDPDLHISRFHIKEEGASDYEHRVEKTLAWGKSFYVKGELKVSNESALEAKDVDSDYRLEDNRDFDKHDTKIDEDSPFDIDPGEKVTKSMSAIAVKVSSDGNTLTVSRGSMSKNFPITNNFCKFYIFADVKEEGREDGDRDISSESDKDEYGVVEVTVQDPSITAGLVAAQTTGTNPLIVQFADTSSGHIDQRNWNFGDGTSSSDQNPSHVYENPGSYVATLTVSNYSHVSSQQITVNVESIDSPNSGTQPPQAPGNLRMTILPK